MVSNMFPLNRFQLENRRFSCLTALIVVSHYSSINKKTHRTPRKNQRFSHVLPPSLTTCNPAISCPGNSTGYRSATCAALPGQDESAWREWCKSPITLRGISLPLASSPGNAATPLCVISAPAWKISVVQVIPRLLFVAPETVLFTCRLSTLCFSLIGGCIK